MSPVNDKLRRKTRGNTRHWYSDSKEASLIWGCFIGSATWPAGYWIEHRDTSFLNLQWVKQGSMILHSGTEEIMVPQNSIVIIPPGNYRLEVNAQQAVEKKHLGIIGTLCLHNLSSFGFNKSIVLTDFHDPIFESEFDQLYGIASRKETFEVLDYASKIYKIILLLSAKIQNRNLPEAITKAKFFMECNLSKNIVLEEICKHAGCCKTTLLNQFKKHLNSTPMKYLTEIRMKQAQKLLRLHDDFLIKNIAEMCGYENPLYFSNVFYQYFGCYPREYRRKK